MEFEDFLRWHNISLVLESMSSYVRGFAYYNGESYLVTINARCCKYQQQTTAIHELIHIFENHFTCPQEYAEQCEKEVRDIIELLKRNLELNNWREGSTI